MDEFQIKLLIKKYLNGQATPDESALLESWYLMQSTVFQRPDEKIIDKNEKLILTHLKSRIKGKKVVRLWPRIGIAAAIAVLITGLYFYRASTSGNAEKSLTSADIAPGKNGATLTLGNGQTILITDAIAGNIASQQGVIISKTKDGQIIYELNGKGNKVKAEYNTLRTTRGEQTKLRLPDGSLVFLNAASSLRYPTNFVESSKRIVSLTGEAYFEIKKDSRHPFIVETDAQQVEVLGTHFNINAYSDEPGVSTALVEGSVKVRSGNLYQLLKPGFQAVSRGNNITVAKADIETITDWKDGDFNLEGLEFKSAMRKIARWYDVEVIYDKTISDNMVSGGWISRDTPLSAILEVIQRSGLVQFRLEGKKLYVSK